MNAKLHYAVLAFDDATGSNYARVDLTMQDQRDLAQLCGPSAFDLPDLKSIFEDETNKTAN